MAHLSVSCLVDNPASWMVPHAWLIAPVVHDWESIPEGDILFLLSCEKKLPAKYLSRNKSTVVVHPSRLPQGRGWSPVAWQVLEGQKEIPVTLFEAAKEIDAGEIYLTGSILLEGHELNEEIKRAQAAETIRLCREYMELFPIQGMQQKGKATYYERRGRESCRLDSNKTIAEQFNTLRVADNDRYPAHFEHNNRKYIIKIYEA